MKGPIVVLLVTIASAVPSYATPILDQSQDYGLVDAAGVQNDVFAQTFTVGVTGTLTRVEIFAGLLRDTNTSLILEVRATELGLPVSDDGLVLASVSLPYTAIPRPADWVVYDVSSFAVAVVQGQQFAISVRAPGGPDSLFSWGATQGDEYGGGARYVRWAGASDWESVLDDAGFRTFVEPVPEPSLLVLVVLGFAAVSTGLRS